MLLKWTYFKDPLHNVEYLSPEKPPEMLLFISGTLNARQSFSFGQCNINQLIISSNLCLQGVKFSKPSRHIFRINYTLSPRCFSKLQSEIKAQQLNVSRFQTKHAPVIKNDPEPRRLTSRKVAAFVIIPVCLSRGYLSYIGLLFSFKIIDLGCRFVKG